MKSSLLLTRPGHTVVGWSARVTAAINIHSLILHSRVTCACCVASCASCSGVWSSPALLSADHNISANLKSQKLQFAALMLPLRPGPKGRHQQLWRAVVECSHSHPAGQECRKDLSQYQTIQTNLSGKQQGWNSIMHPKIKCFSKCMSLVCSWRVTLSR